MHYKKTVLIFSALLLNMAGCKQPANSPSTHISSGMFQHHYITKDLPNAMDWGYGAPVLIDFDKDGDLDYAFSGRDSLYWFENQESKQWVRHPVGTMPVRFLGANVYDVDKDGWDDIVIGSFWYHNPQNPKNQPFERFQFDDRIKTNIHDVVMADINGDGTEDVVIIGESEGLFWYQIPPEPRQPVNWERTVITLDVLVSNNHIHAGFFPKGIGDLDQDGDNDIVLPDRWLENMQNGQTWKKHPLPFGKRGPYGLSARSWIIDLDADGDQDIVMTDCDQKASRIAWLENHGDTPPTFTAHFLPMRAPGIRGSFHSLYVGDFDKDGDQDIFTCDQEDDTLLPEGADPRWYIWENVSDGSHLKFVEQVIFDGGLGGHDALVGDADNDGDLDIFSKVWNLWPGNSNGGCEHGDFLENKIQ